MLANVKEISFPVRGDDRGKLVVQEGLSELVPFDTIPGTVRGKHAHHKTRQLLICTSGACTVECEMPDGTVSSHRLDWPDKGLLVEGMVWHDMKEFSKGAVLLVLASEHYDELDYIRNYDDFKRICAEKKLCV